MMNGEARRALCVRVLFFAHVHVCVLQRLSVSLSLFPNFCSESEERGARARALSLFFAPHNSLGASPKSLFSREEEEEERRMV
jgi:hypothetical protein